MSEAPRAYPKRALFAGFTRIHRMVPQIAIARGIEPAAAWNDVLRRQLWRGEIVGWANVGFTLAQIPSHEWIDLRNDETGATGLVSAEMKFVLSQTPFDGVMMRFPHAQEAGGRTVTRRGQYTAWVEEMAVSDLLQHRSRHTTLGAVANPPPQRPRRPREAPQRQRVRSEMIAAVEKGVDVGKMSEVAWEATFNASRETCRLAWAEIVSNDVDCRPTVDRPRSTIDK